MRKSASEIIRNLEQRIARLENRSASSSDLSSLVEIIETLDSNIIKLERSFDDWSTDASVSGRSLPPSFRAGDMEKVFDTLDDLIEMKDRLSEAHRLLLKLKRHDELG